MAQTDSRAGFRLPWSSERSAAESADGAETVVEGMPDDSQQVGAAGPVNAATDTATSRSGEAGSLLDAGARDSIASAALEAPAVASPRKPSKFLADLTKAMQAAAEDARNATVAQVQADAKAHVEQIHERSASEAAALRRAADDDVAAVREWSKAEIARIREETEARVTARKSRLESEIERHSAEIEREIERVHGHVTAFEQEMAEFFARLLAEEDPSRFATMAERLPEAPPFDSMATMPAIGDRDTGAWASTDAVTGPADVAAATALEAATPVVPEPTIDVPADAELPDEAVLAETRAGIEAAADADEATHAADQPRVLEVASDAVGAHEAAVADGPSSPTDFDAAEAEAAASADVAGEADEIPVIGDDALAARLADLLPGGGSADAADTRTTQVVVTGLVSVASIASFKRHLGRLPGVTSVGVSSGPDAEFIFSVQHTTDVVLSDAIPSLAGFQARVTGADDGTLNVSAHDPESQA